MESNRELFETYQRDVFRTCYFMVHDAADAEDLTQEVFVTVFGSPRRNVEHTKAWIMKITVNHCLNFLKRRQSYYKKIAANPFLFAGNEGKAVDRQVEEREAAEEWKSYLERLPAKIRAVLTLRYMHDFSLAEISDMLSIPLGTAKSRHHKGLRLMKKMLQEAGVQIEQERLVDHYENHRSYTEASIK